MARATIEEQLEDDIFDDKDDPQQLAAVEEPVEETTEDEDELPEKYRGKSIADIARMHQEAERLAGRLGSEVGSLRQKWDEIIESKLKEKEAPKEEEEIDFFTSPEKATAKAIENHPKFKELERLTTEQQQAQAAEKLRKEHPDAGAILQDEAFIKWVSDSRIRTQLYKQADTTYDYDAAHELLSLWKERQGSAQKVVEAEKESRKQTLKAANTGNARGSGETSKKIYRRADIINLMSNDPERYEQLSDEILAAYREGRVK